jgi:hypothetical protein
MIESVGEWPSFEQQEPTFQCVSWISISAAVSTYDFLAKNRREVLNPVSPARFLSGDWKPRE